MTKKVENAPIESRKLNANHPAEGPQRSVQTPESLENLVKAIDPLAEKYISYKRDEAEAENKYLELASRHNTLLTIVLGIFLAAIVGLMSYLTLLNKVSGDALLFLVGTITGYIIVLIQRLVFGMTPKQGPPKE